MELNLRIYWVDTRLRVEPYFETYPNNTYMNANPAMLTNIWIPDVYTGKHKLFIYICVFRDFYI
jgi:hypothetical protein